MEQTEDTTALAKRLEQLEKQLQRKKQRRKQIVLSVGALFLLGAIAVGAWHFYQQHTSFAHQLSSLHAGYTLYAPPSRVGGYSVDRQSLQNNSGYVTYILRNGQRTITVTQQAVPPKPPDLNTFKGFDHLGLAAVGDGVVGQIEGRTISVIVTDATVVNMTGSMGVTKSAVSTLATSLRPIGS